MTSPTAQHYEQAIEEWLDDYGPSNTLAWVQSRAVELELADAGDQRDREEER